jgi:hypothetical protein
MHQKFHKSEVARKFDGESFRGSENPSFLKLYTGCSGPGIHTWAAEGQGHTYCMLKKDKVTYI